MDQAIVIKSLAALAQPVRLEVFRALVVAGPRGMTPSTMAEGLGIASSSLSFHLKELTNAGLVVAERSSRNLIYRAAFDHMDAVLRYLTENCCQGEPCAVDAESGSCRC
jgi:DNA-binding transcriptional ArsR family regulator